MFFVGREGQVTPKGNPSYFAQSPEVLELQTHLVASIGSLLASRPMVEFCAALGGGGGVKS